MIPIGNPLDWSKPIDAAVYGALLLLAHIMWFLNKFFLGIAIIFQNVRLWLVDNLVEIISVFATPFGTFLAFALLLAVSAYGLSRIVTTFVPSWQPVDLGRAFLYGIIGFFYIASASLLVTSIEDIRNEVGRQMASLARTTFTYSLSSLVFGGDGIVLGAPRDIDGQPGISGLDIAATYLGVLNAADLGSSLPGGLRSGYPYAPGLADCCFPYGQGGFDALTDGQRSAALDAARQGITVLFMGFFLAPYAVAGEVVWLFLTLAALVIFLSLPLGFVFSPFRSTQGLLAGYVQQYVHLIRETFLTAVFMGAAQSLILSALYLPDVILWPVNFIVALIAIWRALSALRLIGSAAAGAVRGLGAGSALSIEQGMAGAAGAAVGVGLVGAGVATGNLALAAYGAQSALQSGRTALRGGRVSPWMAVNRLSGQAKGHESPATSDSRLGGGRDAARRHRDREAAREVGREDVYTNSPDAPPVHPPGAGDTLASPAAPGPAPGAPSPVRARVAAVNKWAAYVARSQTHRRHARERTEELGAAGAIIEAIVAQPDGSRQVRHAAEWLGAYTEKVAQAGDGPGEVVARFRRGEAYSQARQWLPEDSPFQERHNFDALADVVVQPQRFVDYDDIITAVAQAPAHAPSPARAAAVELGLAGDFGPYNGLVESIAVAAQNIGANRPLRESDDGQGETYLERAAALLEAGRREDAAGLLAQIESNQHPITELLDRLEVGQAVIRGWQAPQSVAYRPGDQQGYQRSYLARAEPQAARPAAAAPPAPGATEASGSRLGT